MRSIKILVAPDSFKGCLDASEVADGISAGLRRIPCISTVSLPLADGGEGTAAILAKALEAKPVECDAVDALRRPVKVVYFISGTTALLDVATASGLALLRHDELSPMTADTYGTGMIILDGLRRGCSKFIIGLGGSATVDGGSGVMQALGLRPGEAPRSQALRRARFTLICDVEAPLCGPRGAAAVFGPQKGASSREVKALDLKLKDMASVLNIDPMTRGLGAAGGFALPFIGFFGGATDLRPGADAVLDAVGFDAAVAGCDLVFTGEGHIDAQTLMGKLPMAVLRRSHSVDRNVKVVALAGKVDDRSSLISVGFASVRSIHPSSTGQEEGMRPDVAGRHLGEAAYEEAMRLLDRAD